MENDLFGQAAVPPAGPAGKVTHNLFFGLMPDDATRERIVDAVARLRARSSPRGRWLQPHRYHMTLHYLGSFQPLRDDIVDDARRAAGQVEGRGFQLQLDMAGAFPRNRVGWLGCRQADPGLHDLWNALRLALARMRVKVQGATHFRPHVTVLRDAQEALAAQAIEPVAWQVREFVLVDSQLGSRNVYDVLGRWPLR